MIIKKFSLADFEDDRVPPERTSGSVVVSPFSTAAAGGLRTRLTPCTMTNASTTARIAKPRVFFKPPPPTLLTALLR
jgi:hypothetical protein